MTGKLHKLRIVMYTLRNLFFVSNRIIVNTDVVGLWTAVV